MNQALIQSLIDRSLARNITFPEILASLKQEGVESYHVDFLRDEYRYYDKDGQSLVKPVPLEHGAVAPEFSAERLEAMNKKVQAGEVGYPDFVKEAPAAGCAYYIVYVNGRMVRYFGRDGGEYIQRLPGSRY